MKLGKVGSVFLCSGGAESDFRIDCEVRVVAFVCEEGGDTSCCARGVVERKLCEGQ